MDCTVRALAVSAGIAYELAYILYEDAGRTPGKPCPLAIGLGEFERQGMGTYNGISNAIDPSVPNAYATHNCMTVAQFIQRYPKGNYIVRVNARGGGKVKHCFAIVDGVAHDNMKPGSRSRVKTAIRIVRK